MLFNKYDLFKEYDPLKKKRLQILNEKGKLIKPELEPKISEKILLKIYKTMILERVADIKAFQYQRQGRMLTYVLNIGQEACQVAAAAALEKQDWVSPYFRDIGFYLYKGVPLKNIYLYWYGNEKGSKMEPETRILPVNIIIGSGINIGAGLALASKIQKKDEVVVATIGDGGSSHEEFFAGLNYAATFKAPLVVLIQNNQYAISTPRKIASNAATLAQKCYAFGIPGIQIDGNDVLAVYTAVKEAVNKARKGGGSSLIEFYTYRVGAHTTNDNTTLYRTKEEELLWSKKDPILRFEKYLLNKKILTQKDIEQIAIQTNNYVTKVHQEISIDGDKVKPIEVFENIYAEMTPQLKEQYEEYVSLLSNLSKSFLLKGDKK
ncbi:pyruvate dehydrogenase (acetyl-transferring) E1 component subunit alpha [Candidatus Phytoplasma prunorum]|uniref:pyruvate dehydrogenase (acetyl-transferring) E1 component subunit alpha n=1 Tax=Candidatus Phytoplasma prunorum TaxID=47565 RepID=UPI002FF020B2